MNAAKANSKLFGLAKDSCPMTAFQSHCQPESRFRNIWDCIIIICFAYHIIAIPLNITKAVKDRHFSDSITILTIGYLVDILFFADLILWLRFLMYYEEGLVVFDKEQITRTLLRVKM